MAGSTYGKLFTVSTWGESHGKAMGVVIDGCPSGLRLTVEDIQADLDRRRPGNSRFSSARKEADKVDILSGVFNGFTTGTPISLLVANEDCRPKDYEEVRHCYRPGHADYTYQQKYGIRDFRGGGRASGRETLARVAAGAVARRFLGELGIAVIGYTSSIGKVSIDKIDWTQLKRNPLYMPDDKAYQEAREQLELSIANRDSLGGQVECRVTGLPTGIGEPVFHKLDARLSQAVFSIGAVKAVEIGSGVNSSCMRGSKHNDQFTIEGKASNNAGGILGGISDGDEVILRATIKPTPSIGVRQQTVTEQREPKEIELGGRHDPTIVPRVVVVVEAMVALTIADLLLEGCVSRLDVIKQAWSFHSSSKE